jgi:hypothetical protein
LGSGSGFIIESSGKVVTNIHVIDGAHSGKVRLLDGSEYQIEYVLDYNKSRDIAILKIDVSDFPTVKLGDSGNIANGEKILAIGSPFGLENTISDGLISNKNRVVNDQSNIPTNAKLSLADMYEIEHMIYYNDATYEGEIVDGEPQGFGILTFNNGDKYTGDFENNWFHGVGLFEWSNGDVYVYIGDFDEGLRTGFGIYTRPSGDQYEGDWLNGERHGYGIYTYPDGTTDKGMWKNNQFQG